MKASLPTSAFGLVMPQVSLLIPLIMVAPFTILIISARVLGASRPLPPDPFSAYADVFPGQPRSAATAFGFSCPASYFNPDTARFPVETCVFWPATGPFSQIRVTIWDGIIRRLDFAVRENSLTLGDSLFLWGTPEVLRNGDWVHIRWPDHPIIALVWLHRGHFTYFQTLSTISFTLTE